MRGFAAPPEPLMPPRPELGPKPLLGYTESILARVAERRSDEVFLIACEADPRTGTFAIGGELVVMKRSSNGADPLFRPDEARALAPVGEKVFLGLADDAGRFGIALDPEATKALKGHPDLIVTDLRSIAVQGLVGPEHLAPLAEAKALLAWQDRKSTRLNSSHLVISYAVFCLKKKKTNHSTYTASQALPPCDVPGLL